MKVVVTKESEAYLSEYQIKKVVKSYLGRILSQDCFLKEGNLCRLDEGRHGTPDTEVIRVATDTDKAVLTIYEYMAKG